MSQNRFSLGVWAVSVGCVALLAPRQARADVSDAIYSDAKDVIEELLSTEVSHEVAPGIACLSGQRSADPKDKLAVTYSYGPTDKPVTKTVKLEATTHFPKTLQHIYNRQYGSLRNVIRNESASLAGYLVFQALHAAALAPRPGAAATVVAPAPSEYQTRVDQYMATVATQVDKASKDCPTDPNGAPLCRVKASKGARPNLSFANIDAEELAACKTVVKGKFDDGSWGQVASYPLDNECKAQATETFECDVAFAVRSALVGQDAPAQDSLIKATAVVVRELAAEIYPANKALLDTIQQQVLFLLRQQLTGDTWEGKPLTHSLAAISESLVGIKGIDLSQIDAPALSAFLVKLSQASAVLAVQDPATLTPAQRTTFNELTALLAKTMDLSNLSDTQKQAALVAVSSRVSTQASRILELVEQLEHVQAAWRSSIDVSSGKIDVTAFVRGLIANGGALSALCNGHVGSLACKVIDRLDSISGSRGVADKVDEVLSQLQSVLSYAGTRDYQAAAQTTVRYVFQQIDNGDSPEVGVYERFAESVVAYVLDAAEDKTPSNAARVAFRSAAVDMIQHLGQGGGLRRRAWTLDKPLGIRWPKPVPFFAPDLALRASWSPSYVNVTDGSARVLASANMLNFRFPLRRTEATYVGLELSLLDLLAPLSELALRKTDKTHYDRVPNLFANVFSPRLEAVAGSPALSEHLAISAGMSLRMAGATPDPTETAKSGEPSYVYSMFYHAKDPSGTSLWPRFLEFGFAAKYVL